jgi:hypothetical protein
MAKNNEPEIDFTVPHPSRIYDYLLGGTDNFQVDRDAAERGADAVGGLDRARAQVRAQRAFLGRSVRFLALEAGIRQFLDIGTGIPNNDNVHRVAQESAPDSRIVYVDNDPMVLAHAHSLLASTPQGATAYLEADLRDPDDILRRTGETLDFAKPLAVLTVGILHLLRDDEDPYGIIRRLMEAAPAGSYLTITHMAKDIEPDEMNRLASRMSATTPETWTVRTKAEVTRFFAGLELVDPGVVPMDRWRPDQPDPTPPDAPVIPGYGAVGRKP